ncbi:hypothetical protein Mp_6g16410 [Marchantia polymorpha subsp. ruderalis]|uniref:Uncharacterized protein n=2 Tax=Marchantia polymorpha TaxID=3197 RepID=A0AAF6BSQ1_MARPO|nr:hypothetical protein MARPO_0170s0036 [Marchantia polymorpha]BBN15035.1 hypothetical protein Mp_6g16410 [Marchantia polymorpha subsp. ruderalis]|eukprot:PTQ28232.1 hypothetical protein MARPO_0170s0036 [Marchantia polymorpha]
MVHNAVSVKNSVKPSLVTCLSLCRCIRNEQPSFEPATVLDFFSTSVLGLDINRHMWWRGPAVPSRGVLACLSPVTST